MHSTILAQRTAQAHQRVMEAVQTLASRVDLDPAIAKRLAVQHSDPKVKALLQTEALAEVLEAIVQGTESTPIEDLDPDQLTQLAGAIQQVASQKTAEQPQAEAPVKKSRASKKP